MIGTATGPDLPAVTKTVDLRRCWMFSGPSKNYHTDKEQAEKLGFPNVVVQGMMSTCFVSQVMHDHFGPGPNHAPAAGGLVLHTDGAIPLDQDARGLAARAHHQIRAGSGGLEVGFGGAPAPS